jgi:hypothetical protein
MNLKQNKTFLALALLILITACGKQGYRSSLEPGWEEVDIILSRIKAPEFPDRNFPVTDYGAVNDGRLCTDAFKKAIEACHASGGGVVLVPPDTFLTGAIHLLSNVNLHLTSRKISPSLGKVSWMARLQQKTGGPGEAGSNLAGKKECLRDMILGLSPGSLSCQRKECPWKKGNLVTVLTSDPALYSPIYVRTYS